MTLATVSAPGCQPFGSGTHTSVGPLGRAYQPEPLIAKDRFGVARDLIGSHRGRCRLEHRSYAAENRRCDIEIDRGHLNSNHVLGASVPGGGAVRASGTDVKVVRTVRH